MSKQQLFFTFKIQFFRGSSKISQWQIDFKQYLHNLNTCLQSVFPIPHTVNDFTFSIIEVFTTHVAKECSFSHRVTWDLFEGYKRAHHLKSRVFFLPLKGGDTNAENHPLHLKTKPLTLILTFIQPQFADEFYFDTVCAWLPHDPNNIVFEYFAWGILPAISQNLNAAISNVIIIVFFLIDFRICTWQSLISPRKQTAGDASVRCRLDGGREGGIPDSLPLGQVWWKSCWLGYVPRTCGPEQQIWCLLLQAQRYFFCCFFRLQFCHWDSVCNCVSYRSTGILKTQPVFHWIYYFRR